MDIQDSAVTKSASEGIFVLRQKRYCHFSRAYDEQTIFLKFNLAILKIKLNIKELKKKKLKKFMKLIKKLIYII